jgi:hypothetical protein
MLLLFTAQLLPISAVQLLEEFRGFRPSLCTSLGRRRAFVHQSEVA